MLCKSRNWNNNSNDWKDNNIRTGGTDQECEHYNKTFNQTVCFLAQENNTIYEGEKTKQERERKEGRKKENPNGGLQARNGGGTHQHQPWRVRRFRFRICLELSCADRPDRSSDARRQGKDSFRMFSLSNRKVERSLPALGGLREEAVPWVKNRRLV